MIPPIRLSTVPVAPLRLENSAAQPIRLQQLVQGAPVLRLITGAAPAHLAAIAEEAATRERDDPLLLINALLNPDL